MPNRWFVDFDDTLATGPITWAVDHVLPNFIQENQLNSDSDQLSSAILDAQKKENQGVDHKHILNDLFVTLGWPLAFQDRLYVSVMTSFRPQLFDDVIPFLNNIRDSKQPIYVISNNPRSMQIGEKLGINRYFDGWFTPAESEGIQPKPHRSLWDKVTSSTNEINVHESFMIGDDPWSDGQFAENCGMQCWIVDRHDRYKSLYSERPYKWVKSLLDIPIS